MAPDDLRGVAQIIREHRRGALGKGAQGERFYVGEMCHDVDEEEGEGAQVLP
jgi:hypothetical protein